MANQTYSGSCHCGKVSYDVEVDLSAPVMTCNCSRCQRLGTMLTFVTPDKFTLKSGGDSLKDYRFNKHVIAHKFCVECGVQPFAEGQKPDGTKMVAINARCLEGIDLDTLTVRKVNGRAS